MHTPSTPSNNVPPQHRQNLTVLPPLRHRPIRWLESSNRLRPLPTPRRTLPPFVRFGLVHRLALRHRRGEVRTAAFSRLVGGWGWFLCCPVVDIPVVFIEEEIILLELFRGHVWEMGIGEGGEEEVTFESSPLPTLV